MKNAVQMIDEALKCLYQLHPVGISAAEFLTEKPVSSNHQNRLGLLEIAHVPNSEELHLSIFLDPTLVLKPLENATTLSIANLQPFAIASEEVSHFNYLVYHQIYSQRPVSQLELELQAEIDKFIICYLTLNASQILWNRKLFYALFDLFFDTLKLHPNLTDAEMSRYKTAHQVSKKFIWSLVKSKQKLESRHFDDLRKFYHANCTDKINF